ncbi:DMT family transporter [Mesobacillus selenatarsenatis]|uniref:Permease of the drug/metabolite transporter (DMT) superfamily n=1 Tax=Mesobacillus selenatarsenatis (strain DSM 18680 / JCM 14380 / FERM P-15431 / SF-1) TaxID=1321606 RepID=A0A0A8WZK0_MESS1|nr:EamA family transporter [Mesobacillus selenatarsenatis]GAM13098.1 permease of the drug/metabolite transporter (DMT) superfamily [Mesobacillus selenatarsenatis SF-1]
MKFAGVGLVILAAIFWGISGGIADILMTRGWDPIVISLYRGAVGFICFFAWFLFRISQNWTFSTRLYMWSLLAGVGVAGNFTFYFLSIQASSIAVAATLMYTAPVFVLLISFLLRIERSTWFKWGCIAGVLIGITLLTGAYNTQSVSVSFLGVTAGLAAGLSYALFIFGFKNASSIGKPQTTLTIAFFSLCLILFLFADKDEAVSVVTSSDIGWFLLLGIVGAGISFIFYVIGIRRTAPTTASMVAMVEPVTASIFGVLIIGDHLTTIQLIGMMVILVTITVLSVKQSD